MKNGPFGIDAFKPLPKKDKINKTHRNIDNGISVQV